MTDELRCQWCKDRKGGCMLCNAKPLPEPVKMPLPFQPTPAEAADVEADYPPSAWDTTTDYGPRTKKDERENT